MNVLVEISGHQNANYTVDATGVTHRFSLIDTTPSVTPSGTIIDQYGNIDATKFPFVDGYGPNIDTTFRIAGAVLGNDGALYPVRWATATECSGSGPNANVGYGWFTDSEAPGSPKKAIADMWFTQSDSTHITLDDNLEDGAPYCYSLGFVVLDIMGPGSVTYVTIDPRIVTPPPIGQ
ncbi:hypothetical protein EUV02_09365 [Polymorphobacter arshaanensis]|uniref:Uncharacterized protein n=1 Tax=Glacieibacterium arshaanense TaxID=2511025 RepID=A0A4Y9EMT8_9SPHN|nr:hypothetical protein [Polymorphobacter arshaanensis]TFU03376.1 hypothetical protein EUV02_09365 [Polymorphobacter arshaanensis]